MNYIQKQARNSAFIWDIDCLRDTYFRKVNVINTCANRETYILQMSTEQPIAVTFKKLEGRKPGSASDCNDGKPMVTNPSGKKICCACKETKQARDNCIVLNGEDKCSPFIDAHNACLRAEGFNI